MTIRYFRVLLLSRASLSELHTDTDCRGRSRLRDGLCGCNIIPSVVTQSVLDLTEDADTYIKKVKECVWIYGNPSHNYEVSLAVWDYTVLPAIRHRRTHPALPQPDRLVLDLPTI